MNICSKTESEIENKTIKLRNPPRNTESKENRNWHNTGPYYLPNDCAVYGQNGTLQEK
jgi:hypothetical protein